MRKLIKYGTMVSVGVGCIFVRFYGVKHLKLCDTVVVLSSNCVVDSAALFKIWYAIFLSMSQIFSRKK